MSDVLSAREEAEGIAAWHGAEWAAAHRGEDNDLAASTDRLVDALAAAIEVDALCGDDEFYNMPPAVADQILMLRRRLSALRGGSS